jgi:hypothetical protein
VLPDDPGCSDEMGTNLCQLLAIKTTHILEIFVFQLYLTHRCVSNDTNLSYAPSPILLSLCFFLLSRSFLRREELSR